MERAKCLFSKLADIRKRINNKSVYLFFDYDGTLTPIVASPEKAMLSSGTKELIRVLAKIPNCKTAIISGRTLKDIERRVGLNDIVYAGNHGFEIKGPKIRLNIPVSPRYRVALDTIKEGLQRELFGIKGAIIEDKGFSLCLHYRQVKTYNLPIIRDVFARVILVHETRGEVAVRSGKMLFEVRPPLEWDKGKVVLWLLEKQKIILGKKKRKILPIYIGDDLTDEDAFQALNNIGVTIFVGKAQKTLAQYRVKNSDEVVIFLREIKSAITKS